MAFFLGIDGGGTRTTCLVGDETSVLGTVTSAGSNPIRVGGPQARKVLRTAIRQACTAAKVDPKKIQRACIGVAGAARPQISNLVHAAVAKLVGGEIEVVGDMVIAREAAFPDQPGIVVIAGTGSIAFGRNQRGEVARAGGWGFAVSDEGSGHWIGKTAVAAALRARDSGNDRENETRNETGETPGKDHERSSLLTSIMNAWHLETLDDLVRSANSIPPPDFSSLFPPVLAAAASGDALARDILMSAASELAQLAKIVMQRLETSGEALPLALSGGVFQNSPVVRQAFANSVRADYPHVKILPVTTDSAQGALALARKGKDKHD